MSIQALRLTAAAIRFFRVHPPQISRLASARLEDLLGSKSDAKAVLGVLGWGWEDRPRWSFVNGYEPAASVPSLEPPDRPPTLSSLSLYGGRKIGVHYTAGLGNHVVQELARYPLGHRSAMRPATKSVAPLGPMTGPD
jgi:hypothetical protein